MTQLNEKILKAIQEDLPQTTAGELKKFIEEADNTKLQLEQALATNKSQKEQLEVLSTEKAKFNSAERLNLEADLKLKEAQKLSDQLKFDIQKEQITQRDFVINKFEGFLNNLVKNPRAIEMISEFKNVPVWESYQGGGGYHTTRPENTDGTREKIETKD